MNTPEYFPHIDMLLHALRINHERLNSKSKIAIDVKILRALLQTLVARLPFSEKFYLETYPDIATAHTAGAITDPHRHFVEVGYLEGRLGAPPPVDEAFYTTYYKDVAEAVSRGEIESGREHYLRAGAAEGRIPNRQIKPEIDNWIAILRDDARGV